MKFWMAPIWLAVLLLSACQPSPQVAVNEQGYYPLTARVEVNDVDAVLSAVETGVASNVAALFEKIRGPAKPTAERLVFSHPRIPMPSHTDAA